MKFTIHTNELTFEILRFYYFFFPPFLSTSVFGFFIFAFFSSFSFFLFFVFELDLVCIGQTGTYTKHFLSICRQREEPFIFNNFSCVYRDISFLRSAIVVISSTLFFHTFMSIADDVDGNFSQFFFLFLFFFFFFLIFFILLQITSRQFVFRISLFFVDCTVVWILLGFFIFNLSIPLLSIQI